MNSDEIDALIEQHEQLHAIWLKYDPEDNAVAELHQKTAQALRELKQAQETVQSHRYVRTEQEKVIKQLKEQGTRKDGLLRAVEEFTVEAPNERPDPKDSTGEYDGAYYDGYSAACYDLKQAILKEAESE